MDRLPFVGREVELRLLMDALERGAVGQGTVALVEGNPGIGKSLLLGELMRMAAEAPQLEGTTFATGNCFQDMGPQNAYYPFDEILASLAGSPPAKNRLLAGLGTVVKQTAPDWVRVIPLVRPT
jgi:predicted ATPase